METCYCCFSPFATVLTCISSLGYGQLETLTPCPLSNCPCYSCYNEMSSSQGVVVVTGGNRGVGFHVAKIFLQKGMTVYITSRGASRGEVAVKQLREQTGNNRCEYFQVDLANFDTVL